MVRLAYTQTDQKQITWLGVSNPGFADYLRALWFLHNSTHQNYQELR